MTKNPWTPEELALVERSVEEGISTRELSEMIPNRSFGAVGSKKTEVHRQVGISYFRDPWSDEEMNVLFRGIEQNLTNAQIAATLPNRSLSAVASKRAKQPDMKTQRQCSTMQIRCMRCRNWFKSWDVRKNRMCLDCRKMSDDGLTPGRIVGVRQR